MLWFKKKETMSQKITKQIKRPEVIMSAGALVVSLYNYVKTQDIRNYLNDLNLDALDLNGLRKKNQNPATITEATVENTVTTATTVEAEVA